MTDVAWARVGLIEGHGTSRRSGESSQARRSTNTIAIIINTPKLHRPALAFSTAHPAFSPSYTRHVLAPSQKITRQTTDIPGVVRQPPFVICVFVVDCSEAEFEQLAQSQQSMRHPSPPRYAPSSPSADRPLQAQHSYIRSGHKRDVSH